MRRRDLRGRRRLGQPRRVLRGIVVELVAREDLARAVQLETVGLVADDAHLEVPGTGEIALDHRHVVIVEREVQGGGAFVGRVRERHPDGAAELRGLDHQARIAGALGERLELCQDGVPGPAPSARRGPRASRRPAAPAHGTSRLNIALSMPIALAVTPDPV